MRPSNISPDQSIQQLQNNGAFVSSTTPFPEPFETKQPIIDPQVANAVYQQHQININPTYNPLRDENVLNPYVSNAFLNQQVFPNQNTNNLYGVRQGVDGTVSTTLSQNQLQTQNQPTRPNFPFFNWFGNNNNNNNNYNNAQMDSNQQQQGPIISFISQIPNNIQNFAQNNPLTNFLNNFQPNQQQTVQNSNPFQSFLSNAQNTIQNINPFQNIFSTPNKNPVTTQISNILPTLPQSDYIPQGSINNQLDTSVFSNDRFQSPAQFSSNAYNPYINQQYQNTPQFGNLQSNLIANNNPQQLPGFSQNNVQQQLTGYSQNNPSHQLSGYSQNNPLNQLSGYSQNVYPQQQLSGYSQNVNPQQQWPSANNGQQYNQQLLQTQQYPIYQRPLNPSTLVSNNVSKKKNRKKTKNGTKTSVEIPDSDSNWFQDFLDKRKEISIETNTKKSSNKSDEDDDGIEDYFLK